jgi:hypothetical protein
VKRNAVRVKRVIETIDAFKSRRIWVEGVLVFANKRVDLRINNPTVSIVRAANLPDFIIKKTTENEFSAEDLKMIGKEILRQK